MSSRICSPNICDQTELFHMSSWLKKTVFEDQLSDRFRKQLKLWTELL